MTGIDFVWFDFGGVLSPPIPALFEQYRAKTGIPPATLQRAMQVVADDLGVPMLAPVENAMISEREWGARIRNALTSSDPGLDLSKAELENFGKQWFDGVTPNLRMIEAVNSLRRTGLPVGILTNNVIEWEPYWRRMLDLDETVNLVVDSCKERCRKPEPRFFKIACERSGVQAKNSLLIDDVIENIEAAQALGWNTILFTTDHDVLEGITHQTGVDLRNIMEA